jgi:ATP-dependent protease ClpP protease subunit
LRKAGYSYSNDLKTIHELNLICSSIINDLGEIKLDRISKLTINWNRCIYIDGEINEEMVSRLTPKILSFRQESNDVITVAINSLDGSLAATEVLIALLTGPNQDNTRCSIITVVTNKAYSAAANLLAHGDYAIALEHSEILFHDIRFGGMRDVTPDKALNAAKLLRNENEGFSLKLANHIFGRLMWNYIDLKHKFGAVAIQYPDKVTTYNKHLINCGINKIPAVTFDPAMFGVALCDYLSQTNTQLIDTAFHHLGRWGLVMTVTDNTAMYTSDDKLPGLLDGALNLYKSFFDAKAEVINFGGDKNEKDIRLFLTLLLTRLNDNGNSGLEPILEESVSDFRLINSLNDPKHKITASKFMNLHRSVFFSPEAVGILTGNNELKQKEIFKDAEPLVAFMWQFCILLCRELFNGDHMLTPVEALVLGLVDEVPGITFLGSLRKFYIDEKRLHNTSPTA